MKRPKSRGLETRCIVCGNRKRPHDKPQELKVDVRCGKVIDDDYVAAMVAVRTILPLSDVRIIRITT